MRDLIEKVQKSVLLPWQKLHAYLVFIHSKSIFFLKNYYISIKLMNKLDVDIRRQLKLILGVPNNCSNNYLYTPRKKGGCGLRSIRDEYIIQSITHTFRMLFCKDLTMRGIAHYCLLIPILTLVMLFHGSTLNAKTVGETLGGTRLGKLLVWVARYIKHQLNSLLLII